MAMTMLAGLNERLDQSLAHVASLAAALGGARLGVPEEAGKGPEGPGEACGAPRLAGIACEFVEHLRAAHLRIDEIEHAACRLANAING